MQIKRTVDATAEPVDLDELKSHLRIDITDEDDLLEVYLKTARYLCEKYTKRAFVTQTWQLWLDSFPRSQGPWANDWWDGVREGPISFVDSIQNFIVLPRPPLISVTHLKSYDISDDPETFSASNYFIDTVSEPGRLSLNQGQTWPTTQLRPVNGVEIQFQAGYGGATSVPEDIKTAIKIAAGYIYDNRSNDCDTSQLPVTCRTILDQYKIMSINIGESF